MNYADEKTKELIRDILENGCMDKNPRPVWIDPLTEGIVPEIKAGQRIDNDPTTGKLSLYTPAHTLSVNHRMVTYDLSKGQFPIITLRPTAWKSSIKELLWIYQDQSNSLDVLEDKYDIHWWNEWDVGDRTIGARYGETVRRHDLMNKLLNGLKNDPDGRRHILSMWQVDDFETPGLNPCAFQTIWNVRHGNDGIDYLDMVLIQRSSDFITAGSINQTQYAVFLCMVAHVLGYTPGQFTWFVDNIQIYDRHIEAAKELLNREPVECTPTVWINPDVKDWYDFTPDDVKIVGYPLAEVKEQNPQIKLQIAV